MQIHILGTRQAAPGLRNNYDKQCLNTAQRAGMHWRILAKHSIQASAGATYEFAPYAAATCAHSTQPAPRQSTLHPELVASFQAHLFSGHAPAMTASPSRSSEVSVLLL
jgi:hypothetical protein